MFQDNLNKAPSSEPYPHSDLHSNRAPSISGTLYNRCIVNNGENSTGSRLNRLTPYILCAASRLIKRNQMAPLKVKCRDGQMDHIPTGASSSPVPNRKVHTKQYCRTREYTEQIDYEQCYCDMDDFERDKLNSEKNKTDCEIRYLLGHLIKRQEFEDQCNRRIHEWRLLSMFIDKVLFWIFMLTTLATSVIFLVIIPIQRRGL